MDADLNYLGVKYNGEIYYFAIDALGGIIGLIDSEGSFQVDYEKDAFGNVSVSGNLAATLGTYNEILTVGTLYDHVLEIYFTRDGAYVPSHGILIEDISNIKRTGAFEYLADGLSLERSPVVKFAAVHDKVVEVAAENLKERGLDVVPHLYGIDRNGLVRRAIDLWTVDYSITPFSAMNLFNGNTVYEIAYQPNATDTAWKQRAENKINEIVLKYGDERNIEVAFFDNYKPTVGAMKFNGQFVMFGYLVSYACKKFTHAYDRIFILVPIDCQIFYACLHFLPAR